MPADQLDHRNSNSDVERVVQRRGCAFGKQRKQDYLQQVGYNRDRQRQRERIAPSRMVRFDRNAGRDYFARRMDCLSLTG